ncbi:MAG: hypothetical protein A2Z20_10160 [Bdellovibrionales bacterium RBG_16_40_8]|nr:MAG: hypothetical protein A2Z20_10160 [Bdellovibrionales bacterium RBG_16_40_8]
MAWLVETTNRTNEKLAESEAPEAIDTFIPRGFVLVPIEVQNLASLDSIVGQFGVVDLYAEDKTLPVGRGLKLVRSPRDPSQFAVMVSESDSRTIVKHGQKPFHVTVQNPNQVKSEVQTKTQSTKIIWEN